jgi:hypothetical protein
MSSSRCLSLLPRLPVSSIIHSITCSGRRFLHNFVLLYVGSSFPPWLLFIQLHFSHCRSVWSCVCYVYELARTCKEVDLTHIRLSGHENNWRHNYTDSVSGQCNFCRVPVTNTIVVLHAVLHPMTSYIHFRLTVVLVSELLAPHNCDKPLSLRLRSARRCCCASCSSWSFMHPCF